MDAKECPDAKASVLHAPHPFGGLQKGGPWRCNGFGGAVASPEPSPMLGDCGDRDEHPEHDWTEDEGPAGREARTLRCLGWPVPAWGRDPESEDVRTARKTSRANVEAAKMRELDPAGEWYPIGSLAGDHKRSHDGCRCQKEPFVEWEDEDSSEEAHESGTVPGDPKEGSMSSTASVRIRDAKRALNILSAQHTPAQTTEAEERYNESMVALASLIRDYEADSQALEQSNQEIGQRTAEWDVERERLHAQLQELVRRAESAEKRNQPLMVENQALRVRVNNAEKAQQMPMWNPSDEAVGSLLLDCREGANWLLDLSNAKPGSPIPQDNFAKVASKVSQLEKWARAIGARADRVEANHKSMHTMLVERNNEIRELKSANARLRKLAKAKPIKPKTLTLQKYKTCKVCYIEVRPKYRKAHKQWHAALYQSLQHLRQAAAKRDANQALLQDDRGFGALGG